MTIQRIYKWLNKEKSRYYIVDVQKHDTNEIILYHDWGSCNSNRGGRKNLHVQSEEEVNRFIQKMMKRRTSRGYKLIAPTLN